MGIFDWAFGYPVERSAPRLHWPEQAMWTVRHVYAPPKPRETQKDRMAKLLQRRQQRAALRGGKETGE